MGFWKKKIEWSPAGAGTFTELGYIKGEATHAAETAQEETADGTEVYGGTQDVYEVPVYNLTKKAALRTEMLADGLVDLRTTDAEGNVDAVEENFSVIVSEPKQFAPRTRAFFNARFVKSSV